MRKSVLAAAFAALAATAAFATDPGVMELENNSWFRYRGETKSLNFSNMDKSQFLLERGYIRMKQQFTARLAAKMTVDVLSSDGYADGAAIRLKEAYADFSLPVKDLLFTAGLQKNYFSLIYSWDYTNPEKSLADKVGVVASADYGLTLNGFLPSGFGEYQVGVYNGEGYKNVGKKVNKSAAWTGNLRLTPFAGVQVGASVLCNGVDNVAYANGTTGRLSTDRKQWLLPDTGNTKRLGIAPELKLAFGPVSLLGEYIVYNYTREYGYWVADSASGTVSDSTRIAKTKKYAQSGFSVLPVLTLFDRKLEVNARYDMWTINAEGSDGAMVKDTLKSHTLIGAGFNYHFFRREKGKPGMEFQFFWERQQATATSQKPLDIFIAQVRFEWMKELRPAQ
jgi:hypothetical protein